jgi:hypothetical protein
MERNWDDGIDFAALGGKAWPGECHEPAEGTGQHGYVIVLELVYDLAQ